MTTFEIISSICLVITTICVVITACVTLPRAMAERKTLTEEVGDEPRPRKQPSKYLAAAFAPILDLYDEFVDYLKENHRVLSGGLTASSMMALMVTTINAPKPQIGITITLMLGLASVMVMAAGAVFDEA